MHVSVCGFVLGKAVMNSLVLELQEAMSCPKKGLGFDLGSSVRTVCALNCRIVSPNTFVIS